MPDNPAASVVARLAPPRPRQVEGGEWLAQYEDLPPEGRGGTPAEALEAFRLALDEFLQSPGGLDTLRQLAARESPNIAPTKPAPPKPHTERWPR